MKKNLFYFFISKRNQFFLFFLNRIFRNSMKREIMLNFDIFVFFVKSENTDSNSFERDFIIKIFVFEIWNSNVKTPWFCFISKRIFQKEFSANSFLEIYPKNRRLQFSMMNFGENFRLKFKCNKKNVLILKHVLFSNICS